jgi:hypothetical protein
MHAVLTGNPEKQPQKIDNNKPRIGVIHEFY